MPGTGDDRNVVIDLHRAGCAANETPADDAEAERTLLMWAAVVDREKTVLPPEHAKFVAARVDDPKAPLLEVGDGADVNAQVTLSSTGTRFLSSSGFHPYNRQALSKNTRLCHSAGSRVER